MRRHSDDTSGSLLGAGQRGPPTRGGGLPTWSSSSGKRGGGSDGRWPPGPQLRKGRAGLEGAEVTAGLAELILAPAVQLLDRRPRGKKELQQPRPLGQGNTSPFKNLEVSPKTSRTSCSLALGHSESSSPSHSSTRQMGGSHKKDGKGNRIIYKTLCSFLEGAYQGGKSNNKEQDLKDRTG